MNLTQKLAELVTSHMSRPGHVSEVPSEADFAMFGLRAAASANMITRRKILSDVSDVLDCKIEDLEFLYSDIPAAPISNSDVMVPDFQTRLFAIAE